MTIRPKNDSAAAVKRQPVCCWHFAQVAMVQAKPGNQVAEVVEATGPNQINRRDLTREVAINANVFNRSAGEVSADIRKALDGIAFPPGYRYQIGGSTKNMQESFGYALSALGRSATEHIRELLAA